MESDKVIFSKAHQLNFIIEGNADGHYMNRYYINGIDGLYDYLTAVAKATGQKDLISQLISRIVQLESEGRPYKV